jgi:thienamycin biosynthesis protein ThnN
MTPANRQDILRLHTHPDTQSTFWCDRLQRLNLTWQDVVAHPEEIPPMAAEELRPYGIEGFLPKPLLKNRPYLITSETSGFSGQPVLTCFTEQEFIAGFVDPFIQQARHVNFPLLGNWLWAGPSGPHIVGKALREILRQAGGTDAFAVDFDPRWFKSQASGSLSAKRYFQHILRQIESILSRQNITVLYATPPVVNALCDSLEENVREAIEGVHYAGMAISAEQYQRFRTHFPKAVHMSGYGNSLLGMFPETDRTEAGIVYATGSDRLDLQIIQQNANGTIRPCAIGETGQIMASRYDQTLLILNMILEDVATSTEGGICHPHRPHHHLEGKILY